VKNVKKMPDVYGLILAGGSGVRLWPRSREEMPKQFLSLSLREGNTLLQDTVTRMLRVLPAERLYAVAGSAWKSLVSYQAREVAALSDGFLIEEPAARNTAPAILLGCEFLKEKGASDDNVVIVAPSDHIVKNADAFKDALLKAISAAQAGYMVTLGIVPARPDTGFGYIERAGAEQTRHDVWYEVARFVEKPDQAKAAEYIKSKDYFWNGGIFIFTLSTLYRELAHTSPDLYAAAGKGYDSFLKNFDSLPSIAFDYAVMERAAKVAMVELDAGWSDVGSWDALYDVLDKDACGNAVTGDAVIDGAKNCLVDSRSRLTAIVDAEDLIVVDSPDALFISKRGSSQKVRGVVDGLKKCSRKEATQAPESARPWGVYKILCEEERFKIKRIIIIPGKRLSMQYHHHRSEHWVVVRGTALVTIDGRESFVHEGESVFIPQNTRHRLENPGKMDLEIVEIQGGSYLGEDDIVRLDDDFNR
jgi:mannose-1-phosphate guanylyltransferase/mannose-6-phosphate isomerase